MKARAAPPAALISSDAELHEAVAGARSTRRFALDTEFMREKTYFARLCLVQLAADDRVYIVDPLEPVDLAPVAELVGDPDVEVVVHAGRQDFDIIFERFGVVPAGVFDVQIAAGFAGYGASLPYGRLVEAVCKVQLTKGEAYTDWCRRPLTRSQMRYAADDVRYLLQAADALRERLERAGRMQWAVEEMSYLESAASYGVDPGQAWRKVSGRGTLAPRHAAILRELAGWRERAAAEHDLPRGWMLKDPTLIEIARRAPSSVPELNGIRGLTAKVRERWGRDIVAAVQRGRNSPPVDQDPAPPRAALVRARALSGLADAVVRARSERAGIAPELVTTRADLDALLVDASWGTPQRDRHRLLNGWRRPLAGDAVVALARGEIAVRATERSPYVEEMVLDDGEAKL